MSLKKQKKIFIFFSVNRNTYAGWEKQINLVFNHTKNSEVVRIYLNEPWKFISCFLKLLKDKDAIFLFPNFYGVNRVLVAVIRCFTARLMIRVSGGELNLLKRYRFLTLFYRGLPTWVLNREDKKLAFELGLIPHFIGNCVLMGKMNGRIPEYIGRVSVILMVGTISKRKGQIQIVKWLNDIGYSGELNIVGPVTDVENEGIHYFEDLMEITRAVSYNVTISGQLNNLRREYLKSDLLILNSSLEGMPNVVLEASSYGLPVIATDIPGSRDILENLSDRLLYTYADFSSFKSSYDWISKKSNYLEIANKAPKIMSDYYSPINVQERFFNACAESFY